MRLISLVFATMAAALVLSIPAAAKTPINQDWERYKFDGNLGEQQTINLGIVVSSKSTRGGRAAATYVYEPPEGWVIIKPVVRVASKYGDAGYSTSQTAKDADFASEQKIKEVLDAVRAYAAQAKSKKFSASEKEIESWIYENSNKFKSKNEHFEIKWWTTSRQVKKFGIVVDNQNASLNLRLTVTLARVLTAAEADIIGYKLRRAIDRGADPREVLPKPSVAVASGK
jgi:hypothetical protein